MVKKRECSKINAFVTIVSTAPTKNKEDNRSLPEIIYPHNVSLEKGYIALNYMNIFSIRMTLFKKAHTCSEGPRKRHFLMP